MGSAEQVAAYRKRLACRTIHFIEGNHDRITRTQQPLFASWGILSEVNVSKQRIVLCHYAMRVWPRHAQGAWHLYGHSHGNLLDEPFHLHRYVGEQVFRFNNRATKDNPLTDYDRFMLALSQISGKRLTYRELTGKVGETAGW
jgi:hypothetical protein